MLLGDGLDVDTSGRMLPTTSVDEYLAEIALWFGVPVSALDDIIPNIANFYDPRTKQMPLGMVPATNVQW